MSALIQTWSMPLALSEPGTQNLLPWPWTQVTQPSDTPALQLAYGKGPPMPQEIARWLNAKSYEVTIGSAVTLDVIDTIYTLPRGSKTVVTREYRSDFEEGADFEVDPEVVSVDTSDVTAGPGLDGALVAHRCGVAVSPHDDTVIAGNDELLGSPVATGPTVLVIDYVYETHYFSRKLELEVRIGGWNWKAGVWSFDVEVTVFGYDLDSTGGPPTGPQPWWRSGAVGTGFTNATDDLTIVTGAGSVAGIAGAVNDDDPGDRVTVQIAIAEAWAD